MLKTANSAGKDLNVVYKCLTQLEKYHIENSLNNELKKIEKNIKKEKESTKKGKSLLKIKKELKIIIGKVQNTPDCHERYGE